MNSILAWASRIISAHNPQPPSVITRAMHDMLTKVGHGVPDKQAAFQFGDDMVEAAITQGLAKIEPGGMGDVPFWFVVTRRGRAALDKSQVLAR